jgi:hypothetical protein
MPMVMGGPDSNPTVPFPFPGPEESPIACVNSEVSVARVTPECSAAMSKEPMEVYHVPAPFPSNVSKGAGLLPRHSSEQETMFEFNSQESLNHYSAQIDRIPFSIPRSRLRNVAGDPSHICEAPAPAWGGPSNQVASETSWHESIVEYEVQVKGKVSRNLHEIVEPQGEVPKYDPLLLLDPLYFLETVRNEDIGQESSRSTSVADERSAYAFLPTRIGSTGQEELDALQATPLNTPVPMVGSQVLPCQSLIDGSGGPGEEATTNQLPIVRLGRGMNIYNRPWNAHYRKAVKSMSTEYKDSPARSKRKIKIVSDIIEDYQFEFQENGHWEKVSCPRYLKN